MDFQQTPQAPTFEGNWSCSNCKDPITKLPFEPDPSRMSQLLCKKCYKEKKQSRGPGNFGR